jgi:hypothetical protein
MIFIFRMVFSLVSNLLGTILTLAAFVAVDLYLGLGITDMVIDTIINWIEQQVIDEITFW